jgi:CxxC motif-containing protein
MNKLIAKRNCSKDALYAEKMKTKNLEENFNKTSAELMEAKLCFAEDFLSTTKKPATYADAVKSKQPETPGPVTLIAELCNGESNAPELKAIEDLLGSRDGGPVVQSSFHRDGKLYITFGQQKELDAAIHILNSAPNATEIISAKSIPKKLYPIIIRYVMTTNYSGPAEIIADLNSVDGNRCLKGHVTRANVIFTNKRNGKSLIKLLIDRRGSRDEALSRGRIYSITGASNSTMAVNPEREIRRCYNCCRNGHLTSKCPSKLRCGRRAMSHPTHECCSETLRCCNCNGNHISGCRSCP